MYCRQLGNFSHPLSILRWDFPPSTAILFDAIDFTLPPQAASPFTIHTLPFTLHPSHFRRRRPCGLFKYLSHPAAIQAESQRQITALSAFAGLPPAERALRIAVIQAVACVDAGRRLKISAGALAAGKQALNGGAAVLCDVEMVRRGLTAAGRPTHCFLNAPGVAEQARAHGETRSMRALAHWPPLMAGAVAVIGNAPTALFRLLEMLEGEAPRPALIIGLPVGFVGAAQSKAALWRKRETLGIECITLLGRRGGSALAAAAFNALVRGLPTS